MKKLWWFSPACFYFKFLRLQIDQRNFKRLLLLWNNRTSKLIRLAPHHNNIINYFSSPKLRIKHLIISQFENSFEFKSSGPNNKICIHNILHAKRILRFRFQLFLYFTFPADSEYFNVIIVLYRCFTKHSPLSHGFWHAQYFCAEPVRYWIDFNALRLFAETQFASVFNVVHIIRLTYW